MQNNTIYTWLCCLRKTFFSLAQNSLKRPVPLSVFFVFLNVLWGSILYSKLCLSIFLLILFYIWVDCIVNITDLKTVDCTFIGPFALILFRDLRCLLSLFLVYFIYTLSKLMRQNKSCGTFKQHPQRLVFLRKENMSSFHAADDSGAAHVPHTALNTVLQPRAHTPFAWPHSCSESPACHAAPPWRHVAMCCADPRF